MDAMVEKLLKGLETKSALLNLQISEFIGKNEKVDALMAGKVTLPEFIKSITPDDPYKLQELDEGNFVVVASSHKYPPMAFVNRNTVDTIWDHTDIVKKAYPELTDYVDNLYAQVNSASCTSCAKKGHINKLIMEMLALDGRNRDLEALKPILGTKFVDMLHTQEPIKRPPNRPPEPINKPSLPKPSPSMPNPVKTAPSPVYGAKNAPRPSCFNCARKHIGQAIVLLAESMQGYKHHRWLAVGHLAEASDEMLEYPELANLLRAERLNIMDHPDYVPDLTPFFGIIDKAENGY